MSDMKDALNPEWWTDERMDAFLKWLDDHPEVKARMAPPVTLRLGEGLIPRIPKYIDVDGVVYRNEPKDTP